MISSMVVPAAVDVMLCVCKRVCVVCMMGGCGERMLIASCHSCP